MVQYTGRLGSLLAIDNEKGAGWLVYRWYGDVTGDMINVTPPNDNSESVDEATCIDFEKEYISFIVIGPNDGATSFIGSTAKFTVDKVDWTSKDTVSKGPDTVFEKIWV